jgi:hypothetical protein
MKLGTQTNSLVNNLMSRAVIGQPEPFVGMGATILGWTDRYPATITGVVKDKDGKVFWIVVREDRAVRTDKRGMDECQSYEFTTDPDGSRSEFKKDRKGMWREVRMGEKGRMVFTGGKGLRIGERDKYYDFSF